MSNRTQIAIFCLIIGALYAIAGLLALASQGIEYTFGNFLFFSGVVVMLIGIILANKK